jgi:hypothetical protein
MATSSQYSVSTITTSVWDPYQNLNLMANVLNAKETGNYNNSFPTNCSQQWFANPVNNSSTMARGQQRPVFRTVINFGALPNATKKSIPHYIVCNGETTFTRIYGVASNTTGLKYIPLPFVDVTGTNPVQLDVDSTNVNVTTITNLTAYNVCYLILEYILS